MNFEAVKPNMKFNITLISRVYPNEYIDPAVDGPNKKNIGSNILDKKELGGPKDPIRIIATIITVMLPSNTAVNPLLNPDEIAPSIVLPEFISSFRCNYVCINPNTDTKNYPSNTR